jgi:hypothetical protein
MSNALDFYRTKYALEHGELSDNVKDICEYAEEYAEQECIAFAEWIRKNAIDGQDGTWEYLLEHDFISMSFTSKELYQLYLKSKQP